MATKTVYITVRLDIYNPNTSEITDGDILEIVNELDCDFRHEGLEIESEIHGINE